MCPTNRLASFSRPTMLADASASPNPAQLHFLIVDDISSMRRVIGSLLREQLRNIKISEATDGKDALQAIRLAEEGGVPIHFVVTDWNMPRMDGITLLRSIREAEPMRHLPVLLVTAEATRDMILAAARAGADGYIVKPFNAATLKDKLVQIIDRKARHHENSCHQ